MFSPSSAPSGHLPPGGRSWFRPKMGAPAKPSEAGSLGRGGARKRREGDQGEPEPKWTLLRRGTKAGQKRDEFYFSLWYTGSIKAPGYGEPKGLAGKNGFAGTAKAGERRQRGACRNPHPSCPPGNPPPPRGKVMGEAAKAGERQNQFQPPAPTPRTPGPGPETGAGHGGWFHG